MFFVILRKVYILKAQLHNMRITFEIPDDMGLEFHQRCITRKKKMSVELRAMVDSWLRANPEMPKQKMKLALE